MRSRTQCLRPPTPESGREFLDFAQFPHPAVPGARFPRQTAFSGTLGLYEGLMQWVTHAFAISDLNVTIPLLKNPYPKMQAIEKPTTFDAKDPLLISIR